MARRLPNGPRTFLICHVPAHTQAELSEFSPKRKGRWAALLQGMREMRTRSQGHLRDLHPGKGMAVWPQDRYTQWGSPCTLCSYF